MSLSGIKYKTALVIFSLFIIGLGSLYIVKTFKVEDQLADIPKTELVAKSSPQLKKGSLIEEKKTTLLSLTHDEPSSFKTTQTFLYFLIAGLTISLSASTFLLFYILRWRFRVSDVQVSIVPVELLKTLEVQTNAFGQNTSYLKEYIKRISKDREKTDVAMLELQKVFSIFQDSLTKKDQEIDRYKKGYDSTVYKKFLSKFIKFYIDLKKEADAPENQQNAKILSDLLELLGDALLECNVELKTPDLLKHLDDYKEIIGGSRKTKSTNNKELDGRIAEILTPAFVLKNHSGGELLREANIVVYVYEKSEES